MNTLDTIKEQCSEKGWNGYDTCLPISERVLKRAKQIEPYIPKDLELFPAGDNSVQWESKDNNICIEVYEDVIYISSALDLEDSIPYYNIDDAISRIQKFRSDVFCGHFHNDDYVESNINIHLTPSTQCQIDKSSDKFKVSSYTPGYREIHIDNGGLISNDIVRYIV